MIDKIIDSIREGRFVKDIDPVFTKNETIIPGFVDTHSHMAEHGFFLRFPSLDRIRSKKELLEFVASHLEEGRINIFVDYDESSFLDEKNITKEDLDKVSKRIPILLRRVCGHVAVLNTPAIEYFDLLVKIEEMVDVKSGIAFEHLPLRLYEILNPTLKEIGSGILKAQERYIKKGITGILDFAKDTKVFDAYLDLDKKGKLKIKVSVAFYEDAYTSLLERGLYTGWREGRVKVEGIKLFLDGSIGGRTASFYVPYEDGHDKIAPFYSETSLKDKISEFEKNGFKVLMHAIGTRAIDTALRSLPDLPDFNHRIEHFEFPSSWALRSAKSKRTYISMQPNFVVRWWKMYKEALRQDVFFLMHPYRKMKEMGIEFAFGSDSMPEGPIYGLKGVFDHPFHSERLTLKEAIYLYTEKGSKLLKINTGKMAKGFFGDFVVLDLDGKIEYVFVEGKREYVRDNN